MDNRSAINAKKKTFKIPLIHLKFKLTAATFQAASKRSFEFFVKTQTRCYRCEVISKNVIIKKTDGSETRHRIKRLTNKLCMIF